ncbi:MAG: glycogen synthase [Rhodothermales bacterium]|nr:glycogen synthase [Rhodothermales bacterium]
MANATRILFISGEVAPFSEKSPIARIARTLPEALHETGEYETRIMMPRYGTVSERRNRLHEVIRLSGSEITVGDRTEVLRVKVASIPGIRLQVYFTDNDHYFKRKGVFHDKSGKLFEDNLERAAFYSRAVIRTIRNLGWQPDLIHAFGWISGFVPYVVRTEFADDDLFRNARIVYTPDTVDFEAVLSDAHKELLSLNITDSMEGKEPTDIGCDFADAVLHLPGVDTDSDAPVFPEDEEEQMNQAVSVYDSILNSVPA